MSGRYRYITSYLRRHANQVNYNKYYESDHADEIIFYLQQDKKCITNIIEYNFLMMQ